MLEAGRASSLQKVFPLDLKKGAMAVGVWINMHSWYHVGNGYWYSFRNNRCDKVKG